MIQVQTQGIRQDRLDDVTVTDDSVDRVGADGPVPLTNTGHRPVLHCREGLTLGEHGGRGMRLDDLPEGVPRQLLERQTCPRPVVALPDAIVEMSGDSVSPRQDDVGGLSRALERRYDGCRHRNVGKAFRQGLRLLAPPVVEGDARSPAGEYPRGIGCRASMPDQEDGRHGLQPRLRSTWRQNATVIRGLGWYTANEVTPLNDVHSWEQPGDAHPEGLLRDLHARIGQDEGFVWVGLFEPTKAELDMVGDIFQVPRFQMEDAANAEQRPKFEIDDAGHGMAVLKVLDYVDSTSDVLTGQISVILGRGFALTIRYGRTADLTHMRHRLETDAELRSMGAVSVLYTVLDRVVDGYLEVTSEVTIDVEALETEIFSQDPSSEMTNRIYRLKRENVEIRRAVQPLVGWAHDAVDEELSWLPTELRPHFRDIGDHLLRAQDATEAHDSLLLAMLMASTSLQDLQQNRDMRKISAWVAIGVVPTAIAAIYGMNFDTMPELHWTFGYPAVLLLMGTACVLLYRGFRKSGWL